MTVLVLGGYGAVGGRVVSRLREHGVEALAGGRDPARADRVVDLADLAEFRQALAGIDVVVDCSGVEDAALARTAAASGIGFVDVSASTTYLAALAEVDGPVVMGVGIAPGLTGIVAGQAHSAASGPVDIVVGLGAGERHGAAALSWTYGLLGRSFRDPAGTWVRNYTHAASFDMPAESGYGSGSSVRVDFPDQHQLTSTWGVPVRTYLRMDTRLATFGLRALTWMPWLHEIVTEPSFDRARFESDISVSGVSFGADKVRLTSYRIE